MNQEDIIAALEAVKKSGITVNGDLVLEKKVDYEVANVENGGIGIQINHGVQKRKTESTDEEQQGVTDDLNDNENDNGNDGSTSSPQVNEETERGEELNFFAPKKNLQELLKQAWFAEVRTDEKFDAAWTDGFIEALMASEYGEGIAWQWAVKGARNKRTLLKAYVVGLLKDAGVLKGSYIEIGNKTGLNNKERTFSTNMSRGKKQPYAEWVKEYVAG